MNYIFDEDTGVNRENYEMLAVAIITQAIRDVENGLVLKKRLHGRDATNDRDKTTLYIAEDAENFFKSQWFEELSRSKDIDGPTILKQCNRNFFKYGKCTFTKEDWDKVKRGEPLKKGKGRQTIYIGGVNEKNIY